MPFPVTTRVKYNKNPLDRVVCQLRFPPNLKIDSEVPASFQELIRGEFQDFSEKIELKIEIPTGKLSTAETLTQLVQPVATKNYEFASEDGSWHVNLTRSFISLSTNDYKRWEHFREKLRLPLQALIETYAPTHFSRTGLRYIDVIQRSKFDLQEARWDELLKSHILGLLAAREVTDSIRSLETKHDITLTDGQGTVRVVTRFVEAKDSGELCFMIDSDFFNTKKIEVASAFSQLNEFSLRATRLFQWCITERLHRAMQPEAL
jgi:uncharacterized protein (TIGR04255 family)